MKCLLIETKDKRKFVTHEKYLPQLIEFSKTFDATISIINAENVEILKIEDLVSVICDQNYKNEKIKYEILETKIKKDTKDRREMLSSASKIQKHIRDKFLAKEIVSLKETKKKFKKLELSDAALCNHIRRVKERFEKDGFKIQKVGGGMYRIQ
jgi:hypothetical protein